ncbi:hypothetical protein DFH07DRAFT_957387 [Mycena maculata]|uniref:Uncharacterized protein n=1 Tax=Mycena maculata TaxID=230809 RepID=A0AAD7JBB0_9AGAR|nr:hypothetical protein DFH07DRAFT_957387 [Mycena maculata]
MADTEFRAPTREPSFVRPLESHRRSRASHDSAAASTRSWVLMTQQSPPPPAEAPAPAPLDLPEPVPALAPRPLPEPPQRTSALVLDEAGAEHMAVEVPSAEMGYQWTTGRGAKAREGKGFVGGFVSGLRRLPRALVRTRRPRRGTTMTEGTEGTEGTGMTGNTLPQYASNPPTPVVADAGARVGFLRPQTGGLAVGGNADEGRRPRHPSFRVVPPDEDVQQGMGIATPIDLGQGDGEGDGEGEGEGMPGGLAFPEAPLENPYDRETPSNRPISAPALSPHPSRADDRLTAPAEGDEPASVHAHPQPTEDYRRMSAQDVAHPHSRTTITSGSFSADSPSFSSELNGFSRFFNALHILPWVATDRVTADYRPKAKSRTLVSWYYPETEPAVVERPTHPPTADASPASGHRTPPRHRTHRRAATVPDTPTATPPAAYSYPFAYYPAYSPPPTPGGRRPPPSRAHAHASPRSPRAHRHHRRSATYHGAAAWMPPPPAPPAPVYVIQATPPPPPHASPGGESGVATSGSEPGSKRTASPQMLAPVYMQVMPGGERVALVHGSPGYAYAYSSPIAMPAPAQTVLVGLNGHLATPAQAPPLDSLGVRFSWVVSSSTRTFWAGAVIGVERPRPPPHANLALHPCRPAPHSHTRAAGTSSSTARYASARTSSRCSTRNGTRCRLDVCLTGPHVNMQLVRAAAQDIEGQRGARGCYILTYAANRESAVIPASLVPIRPVQLDSKHPLAPAAPTAHRVCRQGTELLLVPPPGEYLP